MKLKKCLLSMLLICGMANLTANEASENSSQYAAAVNPQLFEQYLNQAPPNWYGHRPFAEWLVNYIQPDQVVDLGVDLGYSTFVFANAVLKNGKGIVTGVDLFQGDAMAGFRDTYDYIIKAKNDLNFDNLEIVKGDFEEVAATWDRPIDILHIDGLHTYEAVANDFKAWAPLVAEDGIIIFHDINVFVNPNFQVFRFFHDIQGGHKLYFLQSHGLGIYTKNTALYEKIKEKFSNVYDYETNPLVVE